jgi:hypothetical protein
MSVVIGLVSAGLDFCLRVWYNASIIELPDHGKLDHPLGGWVPTRYRPFVESFSGIVDKVLSVDSGV